jgi:hypothetical protein
MIVHPPPGYEEHRLFMHRLRLEILDISSRSRSSYLTTGNMHVWYYSWMKNHCKKNSSGDKPYVSVESPTHAPGRYKLHAEFLDCHPVEKIIHIQGKKTVDVEIHLRLKVN